MHVTKFKTYLLLLLVFFVSSCGGKKIITADKFKTSMMVSKDSLETTGNIEALYKSLLAQSEKCFQNKTQEIFDEKSKFGINGIGFGKSKKKVGELRFQVTSTKVSETAYQILIHHEEDMKSQIPPHLEAFVSIIDLEKADGKKIKVNLFARRNFMISAVRSWIEEKVTACPAFEKAARPWGHSL